MNEIIFFMILPKTFADESGLINAIIETPFGSRNKYNYDPEYDFFKLKKTLPAGTSFPLDFGFIPHTIGEDGDPLDVLVISDQPTFPGCIIECRLLGVLKSEQKEKNKKKVRNDRFIAVVDSSQTLSDIRNIKDINPKLLEDIINFFKYYNEMDDKIFKLISIHSAKNAIKIIRKNIIK
jgi:inorganic pyrophosphatase